MAQTQNPTSEALEQALALGFDSIEECAEHQAWLTRMAQHRREVAAMVAAGETSGVFDQRMIQTWH